MKKRRPALVSSPGAVLLLGPTGSGKTPLGEAAARSGLWGRRCHHFDFGENLRRAAAAGGRSGRRGILGPSQLAVVRRALATGALLEDGQFPIAAGILVGFLREAHAGPGDLILLNGLPRHIGQARDMGRSIDVVAVVELVAAPAVIRERIRRDTGGDRAGRGDDSLAEIQAKLDIFEKRTRPLVDHYRDRGAAVMRLAIGSRTPAETMRRRLDRAGRIALVKA